MTTTHVDATLDPAQVRTVLALGDDAREQDGVAPLNEAATLAVTDPAPDGVYTHVRALDDEDDLVGYLFSDHADGIAQAECVVSPAHRRNGVGTALLAAARERADSAAESLQVWAHGDLPGAAPLAARAGLAPVRTLLKLATRLDHPVSEPSTPPGTTIRTFVPGQDDTAWLDLNARAFANHPEQGSMTQHDLDQRIGSDWFDPAGFFLAERGGDLVGFHWTKAEHDEGEVYVVGVDPNAQGLGLGSTLTQVGLAHLARRGPRIVTLYVEGDNAPALAVYRKLGFTESARDVLYRG